MTAVAVAVGCFVRERMPRLRASQLAQEFKTLALFHVAIAGSIYIGTTVASRLLLFLFGENAGLCVVVLAVPGWCWQQVGSRPQAEFGSHDQVVKISAEIVGEHLQPNVSLFLGKRLGLKNDAAQSRQFTVRDYVVDLHSANANVLIRPGLLNTGA